MKIFRLCASCLRSHLLSLAIYIVLILLAALTSILSPYIIGDFLDTLIHGSDINAILRFCVIFGGINILRIAVGYITSIIYVKMQVKMGYELNISVIKHIQRLSLSYTNKQDSAYLSQRINNDANSLIIFCITILQNIITNSIMLIVPLIILFTMNWFIAVLLLSFLLAYAILYAVFRKTLYNAGFAFKEAQSRFFAGLFDQLKYIKLIKLNAIQTEVNKRADANFVDLRDNATHNQKVSYMYSSLDGFITTLAQITLFVGGGIQVLNGSFTIGMFTIFSSYFNMMLGASRYFFNMGANYQKVLVAYDRISEIISRNIESCGNMVLNSINSIELDNISFSYNQDTTKRNINNFSARFEKGKMYGITGGNGAGKSTLINLIMGMYVDEREGRVLYNDADIENIDMVKVRRKLIGCAEQEPMLINDTVRYNLTFDERNAQLPMDMKKALQKYLKILNFKEFIEKNTLDLVINDKNSNTSGGEKQKISILKVLFKNPDVMIFDEPTSALDAVAAKSFIEHLTKIKRDKIIIVITHDKELLGLFDDIVEVRG